MQLLPPGHQPNISMSQGQNLMGSRNMKSVEKEATVSLLENSFKLRMKKGLPLMCHLVRLAMFPLLIF